MHMIGIIMVPIRVETRSGHLGQPDHVLSRLSGSDLVYRISESDLDSALDHMHY